MSNDYASLPFGPTKVLYRKNNVFEKDVKKAIDKNLKDFVVPKNVDIELNIQRGDVFAWIRENEQDVTEWNSIDNAKNPYASSVPELISEALKDFVTTFKQKYGQRLI